MTPRHVLITGIRGTVGAHLALGLLERGFLVSGTSRSGDSTGFFASRGINVFSLQIAEDSWEHVLGGESFTDIVHLAGPMPARGNPADEVILRDIVIGTSRMLEFAANSRVERVVFGQSHADTSYLEGSLTPIDADVRRVALLEGDHSTYSIAKNAATDLVLARREHGLRAFVIRMSTIYAYQPDPYFVVNGHRIPLSYRLMMERAERGLHLTVWGDPTRRKEIVFASEFIELVARMLESSSSGGIYNVGNGTGVTIEEQVRGIACVFGPETGIRVEFDPSMPDSRQFVHDVEKNRDELGFVSSLNYLDGLREYKEDMYSTRWDQLWGARIHLARDEL